MRLSACQASAGKDGVLFFVFFKASRGWRLNKDPGLVQRGGGAMCEAVRESAERTHQRQMSSLRRKNIKKKKKKSKEKLKAGLFFGGFKFCFASFVGVR